MNYYIVDVFTDRLFQGNPAGVCILDNWLEDEKLQNIASENNLSETAFLVKQDGCYNLRWFTPSIEVDLCGHATIASAFVLFNFYEKALQAVSFKTISGILNVRQEDSKLFLDLPTRKAQKTHSYEAFDRGFSYSNEGVFKAVDFMIVFNSEEEIRNIKPKFTLLKEIKTEARLDDNSFGIIVTAKGSDCDFVSRFFAPNAGVDEDPVTGRAFCTLIPYWAEKLSKTKMKAKQLSKRTGEIDCEFCGERVLIGAKAVLYLMGNISV